MKQLRLLLTHRLEWIAITCDPIGSPPVEGLGVGFKE